MTINRFINTIITFIKNGMISNEIISRKENVKHYINDEKLLIKINLFTPWKRRLSI